jgi:hypothetical protein
MRRVLAIVVPAAFTARFAAAQEKEKKYLDPIRGDKKSPADGNPWVGAIDFDPEHNVFVLFNHKDKRVWAFRHKTLAIGARAQ